MPREKPVEWLYEAEAARRQEVIERAGEVAFTAILMGFSIMTVNAVEWIIRKYVVKSK